jgi:hypothetical protein
MEDNIMVLSLCIVECQARDLQTIDSLDQSKRQKFQRQFWYIVKDDKFSSDRTQFTTVEPQYYNPRNEYENIIHTV